MKLVVTGANGYIGNRFVAMARQRRWAVIAATRSAPRCAADSWMPYTLEDDIAESDFPKGAVIVHLASDTRGANVDADVELRAVSRLLSAARINGSKLLFMSSQAASPNAATAYGRTKWQAEREVLAAGGVIVRAGLVYGGAPRGLFGKLLLIVRQSPVLPALLPAPFVQPIHVDDLAEALCRIIERPDMSVQQWYLGAAPVSFTTFLRVVARHRLRRRRIFVPIPAIAVAAADRLPLSRISAVVDIGRLRSLIATKPMATISSLAQLGLALRPLEEGMQPSGHGRRRQLAREGRALIRYVLSVAAPSGCVRCYIRAIETLRKGEPLRLPSILERCPAFIALIERDGKGSTVLSELAWRIDTATLIAEASPVGAQRFLLLDKHWRIATLIVIAWVVFVELGFRLIRPVVAPIFRRRMTSSS